MSVRGAFVDADPAARGGGGAPRRARRVLRVDHTTLEVDESSVSSDWTSDEAASAAGAEKEGQQKGKRRRIRKWRAAFRTDKPTYLPPPLSAEQVVMYSAEKRKHCFCIIRGALRPEDIAAAHAAFRHPSVAEILDRKATLSYKHRASRVEFQMRATAPAAYARIMGLMRYADLHIWRQLGSKTTEVYPEMEYIEYDVPTMGECGIEPHVDNKSAQTMVAMLSDTGDFDGGRSCFRTAEPQKRRGRHREVALGKGDAVFFRGEKLLHWVTPVTRGRRVILQNELSRV